MFMKSFTLDEIIDGAVKTILFTNKQMTITFSEKLISFRLPTTRQLAQQLQIPHYYILPFIASMEKEKLITRVERIGISTTNEGSKQLLKILQDKYNDEAKLIVGKSLYNELIRSIKILNNR